MSLRETWRWLKIDRFSRDILKTSLSLVLNASYAVFNLSLAWIYQSDWYLMMAAFLAPLCIIRLRILIFWKKDGAAQDGHGILSFSGIILLLLDMQIAAIIYVSSIRQVAKVHGEIIMITIAAYTFTKLGFAIARAVNARKDSRPLSRTIRCIIYAETAASMLSLQRSMIVSFGNSNHEWELMMNITSGSTVCLFIAVTGISMILYGRTNEIKNRRSK